MAKRKKLKTILGILLIVIGSTAGIASLGSIPFTVSTINETLKASSSENAVAYSFGTAMGWLFFASISTVSLVFGIKFIKK